MKCRNFFNYIPLAKPNKSQAINKAKIKLMELRTIAKMASFRRGELRDLNARKILNGERKRKSTNEKPIPPSKTILAQKGKLLVIR